MEAVQFVSRHDVDIALGLLDGPEVTAGVQVHAAVGKAGLVLDAAIREHPVGLGFGGAVNGRREHLLEGFAGIDKAVQGRCFHHGAIGLYVDGVLLGGQGGIEHEADAAFPAFGFGAGGGFEGGDESAYCLLGKLIQGGIYGYGHALHAEGAVGDGDIGRHGDYLEGLGLRLGTGEGQDSQHHQDCFFHLWFILRLYYAVGTGRRRSSSHENAQ